MDVLDSALMPAVDSPQPGGLRFDELAQLLAVLIEGPRVAGRELTVFDPDHDPDGVFARTLVEKVLTVADRSASP